MKIKEIKQKEKYSSIYVVTFQPNWLEKLLGFEEKQKEYKDTDETYVFGDGNVYLSNDGKILVNGSRIGKVIDKWRRKW